MILELSILYNIRFPKKTAMMLKQSEAKGGKKLS